MRRTPQAADRGTRRRVKITGGTPVPLGFGLGSGLAGAEAGVVFGAEGGFAEDGVGFVEFFHAGGGLGVVVGVGVPLFDEFVEA